MTETFWLHFLLYTNFATFLWLAYYKRKAENNWQSWYQCEVELMRKSDRSGKIKLVVR